jgi:hypothetical protein
MPRKERSFQQVAIRVSIAKQIIQRLAADWAWRDRVLGKFLCSFSMTNGSNYATGPLLVCRLLSEANTVGRQIIALLTLREFFWKPGNETLRLSPPLEGLAKACERFLCCPFRSFDYVTLMDVRSNCCCSLCITRHRERSFQNVADRVSVGRHMIQKLAAEWVWQDRAGVCPQHKYLDGETINASRFAAYDTLKRPQRFLRACLAIPKSQAWMFVLIAALALTESLRIRSGRRGENRFQVISTSPGGSQFQSLRPRGVTYPITEKPAQCADVGPTAHTQYEWWKTAKVPNEDGNSGHVVAPWAAL